MSPLPPEYGKPCLMCFDDLAWSTFRPPDEIESESAVVDGLVTLRSSNMRGRTYGITALARNCSWNSKTGHTPFTDDASKSTWNTQSSPSAWPTCSGRRLGRTTVFAGYLARKLDEIKTWILPAVSVPCGRGLGPKPPLFSNSLKHWAGSCGFLGQGVRRTGRSI
jgi:hypothetical protein